MSEAVRNPNFFIIDDEKVALFLNRSKYDTHDLRFAKSGGGYKVTINGSYKEVLEDFPSLLIHVLYNSQKGLVYRKRKKHFNESFEEVEFDDNLYKYNTNNENVKRDGKGVINEIYGMHPLDVIRKFFDLMIEESKKRNSGVGSWFLIIPDWYRPFGNFVVSNIGCYLYHKGLIDDGILRYDYASRFFFNNMNEDRSMFSYIERSSLISFVAFHHKPEMTTIFHILPLEKDDLKEGAKKCLAEIQEKRGEFKGYRYSNCEISCFDFERYGLKADLFAKLIDYRLKSLSDDGEVILSEPRVLQIKCPSKDKTSGEDTPVNKKVENLYCLQSSVRIVSHMK